MKKIVIVDDDAKIRAALTIRLTAAGYQVQTAATGFDGLVSLLKEKPDLIISDVWMPDGMGFALAERLEELGLTDIPIIFITAGREKGLRETAEEFGAAAFFEKPYDSGKLLKTINRLLRPERAKDAVKLPPTRKTILVGEDDPQIASALTIRLKAAGYDVLSVPDGLRSYVTAMTEKPDLILMDVFMPIASGFLVAKELKDSGFAPIPVIFMTASKDPGVKASAKEIGAAGFFEKPFDLEKLLAAIARALKRTRPMPAAA